MASGHVHESAPPPAAGAAGPAGGGTIRSRARNDRGHGDHGILAMLACCIAIGAAVLLIALGPF